MKSLNELMYGKDYTEKLALLNQKIDVIKENYEGDFDTKSPMYMMQIHQTKGEVKFDVDKDVPEDLRAQLTEAFNSVWK
jgi:hypothetical protein